MKFNSTHDKYLYDGAVVSGVTVGEGSTESPTGWFAEVTLINVGQPGYTPKEGGAIEHYGTAFLILHESNDGIVTVFPFDKVEARDQRLHELRRAHGLFAVGVADESAIEAINGYREAAIFLTVGEDGEPVEQQEYAYSADAQEIIRDDVIRFITGNATQIRGFLKQTRHEWVQIGIDLHLTRNNQTSGFWDRGAGQWGEHLTEAARAFGPLTTYVNEQGELDLH